MGRFSRSVAQARASRTRRSATFTPANVGRYDSGWYTEAEVSKLEHISGTWSCQRGSTYYVVPDEESGPASCSVKTVRPNGQTRVTKALIRAKGRGRKARGLVTFGRNYVLDVDPVSPDVIYWTNMAQPHQGYEWWRMEDASPADKRRFPQFTFSSDEDVNGLAKLRISNCSTRDGDPEPRLQRESRATTSSDGSYEPRFSFAAEDRSELRKVTMSLREASLLLRECHNEQREVDGVWQERIALVREISSLEQTRDKHVVSLKRCREEQNFLKRKLRRCRDVVEKTVASVDDIFAEAAAQAHSGGGEHSADYARRVRHVRKQASQAEAEATALLAMMDAASEEDPCEHSTDPEDDRALMITPPRRKGRPVNCLDGCSEEPVRKPYK